MSFEEGFSTSLDCNTLNLFKKENDDNNNSKNVLQNPHDSDTGSLARPSQTREV